MTTELVKYKTERGEVTLSAEEVKRLLCPLATPAEVGLFIRVCQYHGMNPFLREVYLIKYSADSPASIVVGKDTFTQRACAHPQYAGFEAGIIAQTKDGQIRNSEGSLSLEGDTIVGGWAKVYRKDFERPVTSRVSLREYNRNQSMWKTHPATMIRKVALVQALREAFPERFSGLYDSSELGITVEEEEESESHAALPPTDGTQTPLSQDIPRKVRPVDDQTIFFRTAGEKGIPPEGALARLGVKDYREWVKMGGSLQQALVRL